MAVTTRTLRSNPSVSPGAYKDSHWLNESPLLYHGELRKQGRCNAAWIVSYSYLRTITLMLQARALFSWYNGLARCFLDVVTLGLWGGSRLPSLRSAPWLWPTGPEATATKFHRGKLMMNTNVRTIYTFSTSLAPVPSSSSSPSPSNLSLFGCTAVKPLSINTHIVLLSNIASISSKLRFAVSG